MNLLGENAVSEIGKRALLKVLVSSVKERGHAVVTRPPETWCIVMGKTGEVLLRDSHRRKQYDFKSIHVFQDWAINDKHFFEPVEGSSIEYNCVSVTGIFVQKPSSPKPPATHLQEIWIVQRDTSSGRDFFENRMTGERLWEAPPGATVMPLERVEALELLQGVLHGTGLSLEKVTEYVLRYGKDQAPNVLFDELGS